MTTTKILLMLAFVTIPTLLGFACHAYREDHLARFNPAIGRFVSRLVVAISVLVLAWYFFGWCVVFVFLSRSPAWVGVLGLAGLMFGSLFAMTVGLLGYFEGRPKSRAKPARRLASNGPLWDAELDR